jgi:hypothetical protein
MGVTVATLCRTCGFENKFSIGGGRFNYQTNCPVPAINKETLEFEQVNYYAENCSKEYFLYSDKDLKGVNTNGKTIQNFNLHFNEEGNYCPSCKNKTLAFRTVMFMD